MSDQKQKIKEVPASPKISKQELRAREMAEQAKNRRGDVAKLILAGVLVMLGLWAYYIQPQWPIYLRVLFPVAGIALAVSIVFFWCSLGRSLIRYIKDSTVEIKKVVWPGKNEVWRNTFFVILFTAVMTLFLWIVDSILAWLFLMNV